MRACANRVCATAATAHAVFSNQGVRILVKVKVKHQDTAIGLPAAVWDGYTQNSILIINYGYTHEWGLEQHCLNGVWNSTA